MSVIRYIIPALAVTKAAFGQSCSGTTTIRSGADASGLSSCPTFDGTIAIATEVAETIDIPTVKKLSGDLTAVGASNMTGLTSTSLQSIGGSFILREVQQVTTLSFPLLTSADTIDWETIPNLYALNFGTPGVRHVNSLSIRDTALANLDGISPDTANVVRITNNGGLQRVTMGVTNVTQNLTFNANGNNRLNLNLPSLEGCATLSFSDCGAISIPKLQNVNGTAYFYSNNMLKELSAPALTEVAGLVVTGNEALSNISFPNLMECAKNDLSVQNNTGLTNTIAFPALTTVRGAIKVTGGNWKDFQIPKIEVVSGATILASTGDITNVCNSLRQMSGPNNALKGDFSCKGGAASSGSGGNQGGSSAGGQPKSAASSLTPIATAVLGGFGLLVGLFAGL